MRMRGKRVEVLLHQLKGRSDELAQVSETILAGSERALETTLSVGQEAASTASAVDEISGNLSMIAAATEEFSVNMQQIQESSRRAEDNIRTVSGSTRELAQASDEIAQNTERARSISSQAVNKVAETRSQIASLEVVAQEISDVTQVIHDISEQTKVLALNATIEAARDAEAGRGFAVVAREVKDLASETRQATNFIRQKVNTIGEAIGATTQAIEAVASVISEVNEVVNNIAAAAEEQSITTRDIAHHATSANERFAHMAQAIEESGDTIQDVNRRLSQAASKAQSATKLANNIAASARELAGQSTASFAHILEVGERIQDLNAEFDDLELGSEAVQPPTGKGLFRFSPRYSVLVDDMDADHQKIFDYINRLHEMVKSNSSQAEQVVVLQDLARWTREHFAREEKIMAEHEYPGLPAQLKAHEKLLNTVDGFVDAMKSGHEINLISTLNFLNQWLKQHIMTMDKEYGDYFERNNINARVH
jgi:methyl-accepting chemotaxis protein